MTIADQGDVEALLLRPLSATEAGYIAALLTRADGLIARELPYVRFTGQLDNQTATLRGSGSFEIWLPGRPVVNVDSITLDGRLMDPDEYDWHEFGDVARTLEGAVWPQTSSIAVVWDYGLPTPDEAIVSVAADIVASAIEGAGGIRQESIGGYSISYAQVAARMQVTDAHRRILDHYRYPVAI